MAQSVEDAWNNYLSPKSFKNVHMRLRVVLSCIVDDKGGNSLVETKRGKLFRDATIIDLIEDDDKNEVQEINFGDLEEIQDISND